MASYEQVGSTDTGRGGVCGGFIETALPRHPVGGFVETAPSETTSDSARPTRKRLDHRGPLSIDVSSAWYFITICAEERCGRAVSMKPPPSTPFLARAMDILDAARFRHVNGVWLLALFLVMPDHIHLIAKSPMGGGNGGFIETALPRQPRGALIESALPVWINLFYCRSNN